MLTKIVRTCYSQNSGPGHGNLATTRFSPFLRQWVKLNNNNALWANIYAYPPYELNDFGTSHGFVLVGIPSWTSNTLQYFGDVVEQTDAYLRSRYVPSSHHPNF